VVIQAVVRLRVGVHQSRRQARDGVDQGVLGIDGDLVGGHRRGSPVHDDLAFRAQLVADPPHPHLPHIQHTLGGAQGRLGLVDQRGVNGDIDGICKAARAYPLTGVKKDELDTALGYFGNNAHRMRYKWFRSRGLFVGSGVVEAGCKSVIGQRLKQSGMHWTVAGADAIIALRCREASSQWEAICNTPRTQTRTA
jgi:hypothetical protein